MWEVFQNCGPRWTQIKIAKVGVPSETRCICCDKDWTSKRNDRGVRVRSGGLQQRRNSGVSPGGRDGPSPDLHLAADEG